MTIWQPDLSQRTVPKYLAIADALAADVERGSLEPGQRLPTHRQLARCLGLTVGTVSRAYAEAERRGLVSGEVGRGTFVASPRRTTELSPRGPAMLNGDKELIDLSGNLPAEMADDNARDVLAASLAELATRPDLVDLLRFQPHAGLSRHRAAGSAWIERLGLAAPAERVLVTCGSQHAMAVTLATLTRPGDIVLCAELTYPGLKSLAHLLHVRLRGIVLDEHGLVPESFAAAARGSGSRVLYTVPTLHNPTGRVMPLERRRQIAAIAEDLGVAVVEDDVHGLLLPEPVAPIATFLPTATYYIANTSKSLAPGLRISYLLAPEAMVERLAAAIWSTSWMAPPLMAEIAAAWILDGTAERLLAGRRGEAAARQTLARAILSKQRYEAHPCGYHLWLHLPEPWRAEDFVEQSRQRGVLVTPPAAFLAGRGAAPHAVRVCLGAARDRATLEQALRILAELLAEDPEPYLCIA